MGLLWLFIEEFATLTQGCPRCELDRRRCFFYVRIIQQWNSLSECAVMQPALSSFKREVDKQLGDLLYAVL